MFYTRSTIPGTIAERASLLANQLFQSDVAEFSLFAHSMGGLDARYLISFPDSDTILLFTLDSATALWPVCSLVGDVQIELADGTVRTLVKIEIVVEKPITPV